MSLFAAKEQHNIHTVVGNSTVHCTREFCAARGSKCNRMLYSQIGTKIGNAVVCSCVVCFGSIRQRDREGSQWEVSVEPGANRECSWSGRWWDGGRG